MITLSVIFCWLIICIVHLFSTLLILYIRYKIDQYICSTCYLLLLIPIKFIIEFTYYTYSFATANLKFSYIRFLINIFLSYFYIVLSSSYLFQAHLQESVVGRKEALFSLLAADGAPKIIIFLYRLSPLRPIV